MHPKVLIIIPTNNEVMRECYQGLIRQDYPNYSVLTNLIKQPMPKKPIEKSIRSTINRNDAREKALKTDAEIFGFVDSDTVLPNNTISEMVKQIQGGNIKVIGGWYPYINGSGWAAGKWIADNTIFEPLQAEPSITRWDMVGLGCIFMTRDVLEKVKFKDGTDKYSNRFIGDHKDRIYNGPDIQFTSDCQDAGYEIYANGSVICQHFKRY